MDYVDRFAGMAGARRGAGYSTAGILKFTNLSPPVQHHLARVYVTLSLALALCAAAAYVNVATGFGSTAAALGVLVFTPWLMWTAPTPERLRRRTFLLAAVATCYGLLLGPLVGLAAALHPGALITAVAATSAIFASFSAAALVSQRRSFLFLGGILSSVMTTMAMMRFGSYFFGGRAMVFEMEIYLGLAAFVGYVLFDTQVIIEKAEAGDRDYIAGALNLFVDAIAIFTRVLVILLRSSQKKEERKSRERSAHGGSRRRHAYDS